MQRVKKISVTIGWFLTGFLAWYLSLYIFSFCFSSIATKLMRVIIGHSESLLLNHFAIMVIMHSIEFLMCFSLAMFLSFISRSTLSRVICFIIGAIGISLYIQIQGFVYYLENYQSLPKFVVSHEIIGLSSFLIIVPLMAFLGTKAGTLVKQKSAL